MVTKEYRIARAPKTGRETTNWFVGGRTVWSSQRGAVFTSRKEADAIRKALIAETPALKGRVTTDPVTA